MKKMLITGFEPFLEYKVNPTWDIAKSYDGKTVGEYEVTAKKLKVDFNEGTEQFRNYLEEVKPDLIISLGIAAGRSKVTPERVAINVRDGDKDNNGFAPVDEKLYDDGPDAYFTKLPIREMVNQLIEKGYPAEISNTAGTYLCNNIMYEGLKYAAENEGVKSGFIHIPMNFELAKEHRHYPGWSDRDLQEAVDVCVRVVTD